jgi:hypothetical protein
VASTSNWDRLGAFTPPTGDQGFDDWIAPQRTVAIGRIIEAIKKPHKKIDLLTSEVDLANGIYRAAIETHSKFDRSERLQASNRLKNVKRVIKNIQKQITFISTDPFLSREITTPSGLAIPLIVQLLFQLQNLKNKLSWLAEHKVDLPPTLKSRRPSELEWLAGVALPLVYERNFSSRAGRSRTQRKPGGPTIRFIAATLKELGVFYSEESIVRAMSRLKAFRKELASRSGQITKQKK